jgi:hypothetical protein
MRAVRKAYKTSVEDRLKGTEFEKYNRSAIAEAKAAAAAGMHKPVEANQLPAAALAAAVPTLGKAGALAMAAAASNPTPHESNPDARWRKEHEAMQAIAQANKPGSTPVKPGRESSALTSPSSSSSSAAHGPAAAGAGPSVPTSGDASVRTLTASSPGSIQSAGGASTVTVGADTAPAGAADIGSGSDAGADANAAPKKEKPPQMGDKVLLLDRNLVGTLQFKGPIWGLKKGVWWGIELEGPHGKNDGSYNVSLRAGTMRACAKLVWSLKFGACFVSCSCEGALHLIDVANASLKCCCCLPPSLPPSPLTSLLLSYPPSPSRNAFLAGYHLLLHQGKPWYLCTP